MSYSERRRRKEVRRNRQPVVEQIVPCPVCGARMITQGIPHCPACGWELPIIDLPRIG